jgi:hypothetical protein
MTDLREFAYIVEFSFHPKDEVFVVRFLDNNSYVLKISDLPKKLVTHKPMWKAAELTEDHSALIVPVKGERRLIPFHIIHSRGKQL